MAPAANAIHHHRKFVVCAVPDWPENEEARDILASPDCPITNQNMALKGNDANGYFETALLRSLVLSVLCVLWCDAA